LLKLAFAEFYKDLKLWNWSSMEDSNEIALRRFASISSLNYGVWTISSDVTVLHEVVIVIRLCRLAASLDMIPRRWLWKLWTLQLCCTTTYNEPIIDSHSELFVFSS
jgi:hypothetical protein